MTRKHYEMVACAVASIVNSFENDNPRFDRDKFIAACRPTEGQDELNRLGKPGKEYDSILSS